ncbi:MAG: ABC transporter ATP-binding protein [Nitrososphaerota archaeon]|nr:ABC transporter ATP-binding protein [Nitrososphaerota archaeon]
MSIRLEDIDKSFGKTGVLKRLNLEVEKGELFSVVGPSGSGKTTLLRIIAGLEKQEAGHVILNGRNVDDLGPSQRNVGMVFQDYALYPNKTVLENITSPLIVKGIKRAVAKKEAEEMAEKLHIVETLERRPGQISGGQQQRVALARALVKRPDVFLLDEPLSNLDAQLRFSARRFLKRVQKEFGITTVYVTHDQSEALSLSDRLAVIDRGAVHQIGTPGEIYRSPADEFVAAFIGSPPLNLVRVKFNSGVGSPIRLSLKDVHDGEYRLGIRPESIVVGHGENRGVVNGLEYGGRETIVYLKLGEVEMRALVQDGMQLSLGQEVAFSVRPAEVLVFKGETLV